MALLSISIVKSKCYILKLVPLNLDSIRYFFFNLFNASLKACKGKCFKKIQLSLLPEIVEQIYVAEANRDEDGNFIQGINNFFSEFTDFQYAGVLGILKYIEFNIDGPHSELKTFDGSRCHYNEVTDVTQFQFFC